jgi:hypothetical protein
MGFKKMMQAQLLAMIWLRFRHGALRLRCPLGKLDELCYWQ